MIGIGLGVSFQRGKVPARVKYHVSNTGSDANDGLSEEEPFQTIAKMNTVTLEPGDTVAFEKGGHWREQLNITDSGTAAKKIHITSYGTGDLPIIDAGEITTGWADETGNVWSIANPMPDDWQSDFLIVVIDGVLQAQVATIGEVADGKFFNDGSTTPDTIYIHSTTDPDGKVVEISNRLYGVNCYDQNYVTVSQIEVINCGYIGIRFGAANQENGYGLVHDCVVRRCRIAGIGIWNKFWHSIVEDSEAHECGNGILAWGYQGSTESPSNNGPDYTIFRRNKTYNSPQNRAAAPMFDGSGVQLFVTNHGVIEDCESYNDFIPYFLDSDYGQGHYTVRRCKAFNTNLSTEVLSGIGISVQADGATMHIYYNLVVNYGKRTGGKDNGAINNTYDLGELAELLIANNTVFCTEDVPSDSAIRIKTTGNAIIKNNILVFPSNTDHYKPVADYATAVEGGALVSDYNMYHKIGDGWVVKYGDSYYSTVALWNTASGNDANSLEGDPLFTDVSTLDFTLQAASPAVAAGTPIAGIPLKDVDGNDVSATTPCIGAYEKQ